MTQDHVSIVMMKVIEIDELKKIQIDILLKVHAFCEKNDIHYFINSLYNSTYC